MEFRAEKATATRHVFVYTISCTLYDSNKCAYKVHYMQNPVSRVPLDNTMELILGSHDAVRDGTAVSTCIRTYVEMAVKVFKDVWPEMAKPKFAVRKRPE